MEKSEVIAFLESENIKDRDFMDSGMQDFIAEIIMKWEMLQSYNRMMQPRIDYLKKHFSKDGLILESFTEEQQTEIRKNMKRISPEDYRKQYMGNLEDINLKQIESREILLHHKISGNTGCFIEVKKGYHGEITIIKLQNGREYYAPSSEFERI